MEKRARRCLDILIVAAAVLGGGFLLLRFVLPGLAPFLLAYVLAALTEPAVRALGRARLPRTAAAALVTLTLLGLLFFRIICSPPGKSPPCFSLSTLSAKGSEIRWLASEGEDATFQ